MKPIVHYDKTKPLIFDLDFAWLTPLDHYVPNLNGREVNTSRIVTYNEDSGQLVTQNTIYLPK